MGSSRNGGLILLLTFNSAELAFKGCQRLYEKETTKKESMISDIIKALVTKYRGNNSSISDLRFLLTCLLGFAGILRIERSYLMLS